MDEEIREEQLDEEKDSDVEGHVFIKWGVTEDADDDEELNVTKK
jgi:hypothetical protein